MYLENRLHCDWETDYGAGPSSSKRSNASIETQEKHWLKLSSLYRDLSEHDVVAGIFADKLSVGDDKMTRAISLEMNNDLVSAKLEYASIINRSNLLEKDFAYESYYKLYEIMGDWSTLSEQCHQQIETHEELWDEWNLEFLMPHVMRAELQLILANEPHNKDFLKSLEAWIRAPKKSDYLSIHFGEELMMLHIANQQYRHARVYAEQHFTAFLSEWRNLTALSGRVRSKKLFATRTVAEMYRYTDLLLNTENVGVSDVTLLRRRWSSAQPQLTDSTQLWNAILSYRGFVCDMITTEGGQAIEDMNLRECLNGSQYRLLDVALHQRNIPLSNRIIHRLQGSAPMAEWLIARSRQQSLKAMRAVGPLLQINLHLNACKRLKTKVLLPEVVADNVSLHRNALEELAAISVRLLGVVSVVDELQADTLQSLHELTEISMGKSIIIMSHVHTNVTQSALNSKSLLN